MSERHSGWSRRAFLGGFTLAGAAGLVGVRPPPVTAEPAPEVTRIRLLRSSRGVCWAPQYVAEDLLRAEGFTEVEYGASADAEVIAKALASDLADISMQFVAPNLIRFEMRDPIVFLAGGHVGCIDLRGTDKVRSTRDLKGKTVGVTGGVTGATYGFVASMATYVGLDPGRDIRWEAHPQEELRRLLAEGKVDAALAIAPMAQEMSGKRIGRSIVNTTTDRPWSQYFCCMVIGRQAFVRKYPVATKRALRAILKAADLCAAEPERIARSLVEKKYVTQYDYTLQAIRDLPYGKWREYDPEDTIRFYSLRLREAGLLKSSPQKLIAQGTNWRFLNELKMELKG
jgi:NitT/TauT family transport system substrate-binding protein